MSFHKNKPFFFYFSPLYFLLSLFTFFYPSLLSFIPLFLSFFPLLTLFFPSFFSFSPLFSFFSLSLHFFSFLSLFSSFFILDFFHPLFQKLIFSPDPFGHKLGRIYTPGFDAASLGGGGGLRNLSIKHRHSWGWRGGVKVRYLGKKFATKLLKCFLKNIFHSLKH